MKIEAGIALALLSLASCHHAATPAPPAHSMAPDYTSFVRVAEAQLDTRGSALIANGTVAFDEEHVAAIIPPVQGRVIRLLAAAGDHVAADAALAIVYSAEVAGAGAGLSEARINRVAAEQALARAERLSSEGAASAREVIDARTALANARAEELRAGAALRAMGAAATGAATYTLRAPIAGTVVRRALRVGAEARPDASEPAFLIADLAHIWVLAYLHEAQAATVHAGDHAQIALAALPGRQFDGVVSRISDSIDPNVRSLVVRIALDNPDLALKPDMFARVTIFTQATNVISLPTTALVTEEHGYAVFVQKPDGKFERRTVTVGAEMGDNTQVLTGLHPGERVVVEGALLLDASVDQVL